MPNAVSTGSVAQKAQLAQASASEKPSMRSYIKGMESEIAKALPAVITPERFTRMVLTALSTTPKLAVCTPQSFLGAMMSAAQLGLEPNTPLGQAYLIPRENRRKGVTETVFEIGYKGLIDLAYRSGMVSTIGAWEVRQNDEFAYELGVAQALKHVPAAKDRGEPVAYYAVLKMKDGGYSFCVMTMDEITAHAAKYSESYKGGFSSPWKTNFDEMAKKTVLKRLLKYCPLKSDFARAVTADGAVKSTISADMYEEPAEYIVAEGTVDEETGEVHPAAAQTE